MKPTTLISFLTLLPPLISAHGRITNITTSAGVVYTGWDPELALRSATIPPSAAWSASNLGNIYVSPSSFDTSNITCHFNAQPGSLHINATAGSTLKLQWNEWPTSHVGPVLSYLAPCNGSSCAEADKEYLQWVKIDEMGWLNSTGWEIGLGGTWATDVLIANGFSWLLKVPEGLAEGNYVLRHEIIALHVANEMDGAQAYPQCVNLRVVKGVGSESGDGQVKKIEGGVVGSRLYRAEDKGVLVDVHGKIGGYEIPGPKVWSGATTVKQPNERWESSGRLSKG